MKKKKSLPYIVLSITLAVLSFIIFTENVDTDPESQAFISKKEMKAQRKKARSEYFFNILKDPATNSIPKNIRNRELEFAKKLPQKNNSMLKTNEIPLNWFEAGPNDVGGRTRALAVDRTNSDVIIAGGVSGGIWKSTDNGESWELKSKKNQQLSVTYVIQDPAPGRENIWYYSSGENKSSWGASSNDDKFFGSGFYKSTDYGENWQQIQSANNINELDSQFDFVSKIVISPITGSIFISSNFGIYRSDDGGNTFERVLSGFLLGHEYVEIDVASNGNLIATLSGDNTIYNSGIYYSKEDGNAGTWLKVNTPEDYQTPQRAVVDFAPSNPDVAYIWTEFSTDTDTSNTRLFKYNFSTNTLEERTQNLPDFGAPNGKILSQGSYNMILRVKPDDEDFVLLGDVNLWRSFDGFATPLNDKIKHWIGGYDHSNDNSDYPNHHSDQHALFFDPNDPNKLWSGHDGGLAYNSNITQQSQKIDWVDKNNGYNVTQFYHISIGEVNDTLNIVGGMQDNGTHSFSVNQDRSTSNSEQVTGGDGSFSHIGQNKFFISTQNAEIYAISLVEKKISSLTPSEMKNSNKLFIHPFVVDPNNDDNIYIPELNTLWRNTIVSQADTITGWENLGNVSENVVITALSVSTQPSDILYLGLTGSSTNIIKIETASTSNEFQNISIPDAILGAYLTNISINPEDANEFIVVFGNYNVPSLFHTTDGGQSYAPIEGNLAGDANNPGPSIRDAEIITIQGQKLYLLATSTGVYSTQFIDGDNTVWQQESADVVGNVPAIYVTSYEDKIAVATHGRGVFVGSPVPATSVSSTEIPTNFVLDQNYPNPFNPSTKISFSIPNSANVSLKVFNNIGEQVAVLKDGIMNAGSHQVSFDGSGLASGVYYYRIEAGDFVSTKKMMLLK